MNKPTYQPKGGMCLSCEHRFRDCSHLAFEGVYVVEDVNELRIVRCTEYEKAIPRGVLK